MITEIRASVRENLGSCRCNVSLPDRLREISAALFQFISCSSYTLSYMPVLVVILSHVNPGLQICIFRYFFQTLKPRLAVLMSSVAHK